MVWLAVTDKTVWWYYLVAWASYSWDLVICNSCFSDIISSSCSALSVNILLCNCYSNTNHCITDRLIRLFITHKEEFYILSSSPIRNSSLYSYNITPNTPPNSSHTAKDSKCPWWLMIILMPIQIHWKMYKYWSG